jgi:hypothetical protein
MTRSIVKEVRFDSKVVVEVEVFVSANYASGYFLKAQPCRRNFDYE